MGVSQHSDKKKNGRDLWLNPDVRNVDGKRLSLVPGNIQSEQTIRNSYTAEKSTTGIQAVLSEKQNKTKQKQQQFQKQINYKFNYSNNKDS